MLLFEMPILIRQQSVSVGAGDFEAARSTFVNKVGFYIARPPVSQGPDINFAKAVTLDEGEQTVIVSRDDAGLLNVLLQMPDDCFLGIIPYGPAKQDDGKDDDASHGSAVGHGGVKEGAKANDQHGMPQKDEQEIVDDLNNQKGCAQDDHDQRTGDGKGQEQDEQGDNGDDDKEDVRHKRLTSLP